MTATDSAFTMVRHTLEVFLAPEQISEVRAFPPGPRDQPALHKTLYRDHDLMARKATGLDEAAGIYFVPNPIAPAALPAGRPAGGRSVKDDDIACRHWLLLDVDPHRFDPAGKRLEGDHPSSDSERESAWQAASRCRELCEGAGLINTVLADSGNGWHLCWPIDLPNDLASYSLIDAFLAGLQKRCGDKSSYIDPKVKNASRIWKLYGTTARKGPATEDRPHRESRLIEGEPWNALAAAANNAALTRLIALWQAQDTLWGQRGTSSAKPDPYARCLEYLAKCEPAVSGQGGHDKLLWAARCAVLGFDLGADAGLRALQEAYNQRCTPPWSDKELQHKCKEADTKPFGRPRGWLLEDGGAERNGHAGSNGPAKATVSPDDVATIDDLILAGAEIQWLWPGWIQTGVLTLLAAEGGTGKTRFCADLVRRIRHGLAWPDGAAMELPATALAMWVMSDNHHDEIVTLTQAFGIKESIRLNACKADPFGGVTLDSAEDLAALDGRIEAVKPVLVVVDTVGNATDKNLSKQEEAKAFYQPLQVIARRHRTAIFCLTHLNASGAVLGRRATEKCRVVVRMNKPDADQPNRRRLEVVKTNTRYPAHLGVTMHDKGNDYDDEPPEAPEAGPGTSKPSPRMTEAREWLREKLSAGPVRVSVVRKDAEVAGFSAGVLYRAKDSLAVEECEVQGKKWWSLTSSDPIPD